MTTTQIHPADVRIVPEWELQDRLKRSLRLVGLDVTEVAEFFGVSRETVSRWTHGRNKPSRAVLRVWSDMTGVDLDWLETGEGTQRACRDSNPKPSVLVLVDLGRVKSVRTGLTANRPVVGHRPTYLRSVS